MKSVAKPSGAQPREGRESRTARPGSAKSDKHVPLKRGQPVKVPGTIGTWVPR